MTGSSTPAPRNYERCFHCGADEMLHQASTDRCPANGQESGDVGATGWRETIFTLRPQPQEVAATSDNEKPIHAKPQLYAYYFLHLKEIAKEFGYNLLVHGSMNRDLDLIAIPWVDDPKPELSMIHALHKHITGYEAHEDHWKHVYMFTTLPGGRKSYVININRRQTDGNGNYQEDPQYYIDISVTQIPAPVSGVAAPTGGSEFDEDSDFPSIYAEGMWLMTERLFPPEDYGENSDCERLYHILEEASKRALKAEGELAALKALLVDIKADCLASDMGNELSLNVLTRIDSVKV